MNRKINELLGLAIILCVLMVIFSVPVLSHSHESNVMDGDFLDARYEIRAIAQNIYDESEYIVQDESLDPEIRSVAEDVHQVAHKVDISAHDMKHHIDDGDHEKAANELETLKSYIIELDGLVHDLWDYEFYESQHHADEIHDEMHVLQHKFQEFEVMFYSYVDVHEHNEENHTDSSDLSINEKLLELSNEIRAIAKNIHDESGYIAGDQSLDFEIRAPAEEVYQLSHKIDRSAHDIRHYIDDGGVEYAQNEMENLKSLVNDLDRHVHDLDRMTPYSHKGHADAVHNGVHALEHKVDDFSQLFGEWVELKSSNEYDVSSEEPASDIPGFQIVLSAAGLVAAAFIVRKIQG